MKAIRKIFATVICLAMIMSCTFTGVTFAASEFTDLTEAHTFYQAIVDLADKGIINGMANDGGETYRFEPDSTITRAEFAKLIAVADAPTGFAFTNAVSSFTDVAADYWAVPYIEYAVGRKIINGKGDGTFAPTAPVTYAEAMKMIVCALNYGNVIDTTNPTNDPNWKWYDPYISLGNQLNLNKNASIPAETPATRGLIAQMVFNMNKATPAVQTGTDKEGNPVYGLGDSTKEEASKGTKTEEGLLLAVFKESVTGQTEDLNKKEALVLVGDDEEIFLIGNFSVADIAAYMGYKVKITYSEDESGENVIEKISKTSSNKEYTIEDIDISVIYDDKIEFYDESARNGIDSLKFSSDMKVFRNGSIVDDEDVADELSVDSGEIRFIDYDGNSKMDFAFINKYETMYVGSVTNANGKYTVYDKFDSTKKEELDSNDDDIVIKMMANGSNDLTSGSFSSIAATNIVSIAKEYDADAVGKNGKVVEIIVSKKTVSGSTATSEVTYVNGDYTIVGFKKGDYDVSAYYLANLDNATYPQELSTGDICTVYLDFTGKIAAVNKTTTSLSYGYITNVGRASTGIDSDDYLVSMYDTTGKYYAKLPVATKGFKINGSSADAEDLVEAITNAAGIVNEGKDEEIIENAEKAVLVKYEISSGALKAVHVLEEDETNIKASYIFEGDAEDYLSFDTSSNSFKSGSSSKFKISASTKVFIVPLDRRDTDYRVTTGTGYFSNGGHYKIDAYDVEGNTPAKAVVVYGIDTTIKPGAETIFVKKIENTQNDDRKEVQLLYYHTVDSKWDDSLFDGQGGNTYLTVETKDDDTLDGVEPGDIIKVFKNGNIVERIQHIYSVSDGLLTEDVIADGGSYDDETGVLKHNSGGSYYNIMFGTVTVSPKEDSGNGNMSVSFDFDADDYEEYLEALEALEEAEDEEAEDEAAEDEAAEDEEAEEVEEYIFNEVGYKLGTSTAIIKYVGDEASGRNPEIFEFGKIAEDILDIYPDPQAASKVVVFRYGEQSAAKAIIIYE